MLSFLLRLFFAKQYKMIARKCLAMGDFSRVVFKYIDCEIRKVCESITEIVGRSFKSRQVADKYIYICI